jgi:hypothetical protein
MLFFRYVSITFPIYVSTCINAQMFELIAFYNFGFKVMMLNGKNPCMRCDDSSGFRTYCHDTIATFIIASRAHTEWRLFHGPCIWLYVILVGIFLASLSNGRIRIWILEKYAVGVTGTWNYPRISSSDGIWYQGRWEFWSWKQKYNLKWKPRGKLQNVKWRVKKKK